MGVCDDALGGVRARTGLGDDDEPARPHIVENAAFENVPVVGGNRPEMLQVPVHSLHLERERGDEQRPPQATPVSFREDLLRAPIAQ